MNVRSLSPEGGGVLLPFRGQRDGDAPEQPSADGRAADSAARGSGAREGGAPTVVHLTGRRRAAEPEAQPRRGPRWVRVTVVLTCAVLAVGGATAAALTGVLPLTTDRPQPRAAVSAPPTSAGAESANLPAAYGLCTAFDRAADRGDDVATAQAFRNLAHAAGGSSRVSAYCAPFDDLDRGRAR